MSIFATAALTRLPQATLCPLEYLKITLNEEAFIRYSLIQFIITRPRVYRYDELIPVYVVCL